jgi:hypothetical protein
LALEENLTTLLGGMIGLAWPIAGAIMHGAGSNGARLDILKNVAIVQPYSDAYLVQLGRVITQVTKLDRARKDHMDPQWFRTSPRPEFDSASAQYAEALRRNEDIKRLIADLSHISREVLNLVDYLPSARITVSPRPNTAEKDSPRTFD